MLTNTEKTDRQHIAAFNWPDGASMSAGISDCRAQFITNA